MGAFLLLESFKKLISISNSIHSGCLNQNFREFGGEARTLTVKVTATSRLLLLLVLSLSHTKLMAREARFLPYPHFLL